jgi:hypothetical protein
MFFFLAKLKKTNFVGFFFSFAKKKAKRKKKGERKEGRESLLSLVKLRSLFGSVRLCLTEIASLKKKESQGFPC